MRKLFDITWTIPKFNQIFKFFLKNTLRSFEIAIEYSCWEWIFKLNIFLTAGIMFVTMMIHNIFCSWETWLILYLIVKSLASDEVIFITWWIFFAIISWPLWIYKIKIAALFLTLVSKIINTVSCLVRKFL